MIAILKFTTSKSAQFENRRLQVIYAYTPTAPRTTEDPWMTVDFWEASTVLSLGLTFPSLTETSTLHCSLTATSWRTQLAQQQLESPLVLHPGREPRGSGCFLAAMLAKAVSFFVSNNRVTPRTGSSSFHHETTPGLDHQHPTTMHRALVLYEADLLWPHLKSPRPQPLWSALTFVGQMMSASFNLEKSIASFSKAVNEPRNTNPSGACPLQWSKLPPKMKISECSSEQSHVHHLPIIKRAWLFCIHHSIKKRYHTAIFKEFLEECCEILVDTALNFIFHNALFNYSQSQFF